MDRDLYKILGVQPTASLEEIKRNFHKLSQIYHPDKNGGDDELFKELNSAYQVLKDEGARRDYDKIRRLRHKKTTDEKTNMRDNQKDNDDIEKKQNRGAHTVLADKKGLIGLVLVLAAIGLAVSTGFWSGHGSAPSRDVVSVTGKNVISAQEKELSVWRQLENKKQPIVAETIDTKCYPNGKIQISDFQTSMYSVGGDSDIKPQSNEMKVFGLIKNTSSNCVAKNIYMRFVIENDRKEEIQSYELTIKDPGSIDLSWTARNIADRNSVVPTKFSPFENIATISPGKTTEFKGIFTVYDSLVVTGRVSVFDKYLKAGFHMSATVVKVDWISAK